MKYKFLNANALKVIAIIAMTLDHVAATFITPSGGVDCYWYVVLRVIGRLTMPIMCFLIAEGYHHTRDWRKYLARLFVFALVSHFAFIYLFNYQDALSFIPFAHGEWRSQTSVMWGLAWGLILLRIHDSQWKLPLKWLATLIVIVITLPADWMCVTPLLILAFWKNRGHFALQTLWLFIIALCDVIAESLFHVGLSAINLMMILSALILWFYNGQRGKSSRVNAFLKWFFYLYYPLHLFILGLLVYHGIFPIG